MQFFSHSSSADRVLPVLPSLEYASNDFLLAVAAPAAAVERYRRLRLHRALGSLPSDVSLTPALPEARGGLVDMTGLVAGGSSGEGGENALGYNLGQYTGDVAAASWNSTALFCSDLGLYEARMNVVMSLLPSHDALLLQEVHGTSGMLEAWPRPRGYQAFFSPGANAGCAGVGILLSELFLQNFENAHQITEVWKGRALKVSLRGRKGCLDIWSVYFPTGDAITANDLYDVPLRDQLNCRHFVDLRNLMRNRMRASLSSSLEAASVVGGGFNYVIDSGDRRALNTMAETGSRNRSEENHWQNGWPGRSTWL